MVVQDEWLNIWTQVFHNHSSRLCRKYGMSRNSQSMKVWTTVFSSSRWSFTTLSEVSSTNTVSKARALGDCFSSANKRYCSEFSNKPCTGITCTVTGRRFFFFFFICSDRNSSRPDIFCCTLEVLHRAVDYLSHWYVSRPGFFLSGSDWSDSPAWGILLPQVMYWSGILKQSPKSSAELCEYIYGTSVWNV